MAKYQKKVMEHKDKRNKTMNEVLNGMRIIKFFAWETSFYDRVTFIRNAELSSLRTTQLMRAAFIFIFVSTPLFVSMAVFGTYVGLGHELTAPIAFTALSLLKIMRAPLIIFPMVVSFSVDCKISIDRLTKFLASEEADSYVGSDPADENAVEIQGGEFEWVDNKSVLSDIDLKVKKGELLAVIGTVGSGKSSLLSAMLGEIPKSNGTVKVNGSVAYVPQQAWMQNAKIKENVYFGKTPDVKRYERAVAVCELSKDLEIFPAGDETEIGEKGINLSGGQKQRISIARAVYQDDDIYLMDDPLSAVDVHVGQAIFDNCIAGALHGKTRVLVTHNLYMLPNVDRIAVIVKGKVVELGTYDELMAKGQEFTRLIEELKENDEENGLRGSEDDPDTPRTPRKLNKSSGSNTSLNSPRKLEKSGSIELKKSQSMVVDEKAKEGKLMEKEKRGEGQISMHTYHKYIIAVGGYMIALLLMLVFIIASVSSMATDWWTSQWTANKYHKDKKSLFYLEVYIGISFCFCFVTLFHSVILIIVGLFAAKNMHQDMLRNILRAPMSFFDTTPSGRILNRFAKDQSVLDETLPPSLGSLVRTCLSVVGIIVIIISVTPIILVLLLPLSFVYKFVQRYYILAAVDLKRMDSVSKSPVFALFSETLAGTSTIKAYNRVNDFVSLNERKVDENMRAYWLTQVANRWLGIRLEFLGNIVVFGAALFAVLQHNSLAAGLAGLSIIYAMQLTTSLNFLVRSSTDAENNLVSVERCVEFSNVETEAPAVRPGIDPPAGWPAKGSVEFKNYKLRYRDGLPLVLKGVNCAIKPQEKIGIVGRTGAGKSSLMLALFRMCEAAEGSIHIDGINIATIGLDSLRRGIAIIPQDPMLFTGTIRSNLDPFTEYADNELWECLKSVELQEQIEDMEGTLDAKVTENGENLSVGSRQLLCLARALLRKSPIIVMDEATANIDFETDALIQKTIRSEFANATVLTIAHRINTIIDSDRVMVLDQGKIIEFESPKKLMKNSKSLFYSLVKESEKQAEGTA
eukprot:CAMPEP_0168519036 /NCGR_PEP_ID=MMETSP0405-20121227/7077_1 /TAXON_ID=498012 /ORGANISM="Trichosphaerium sp, Strain Am-I-7 wt" /LENGTH=1028 /DNA_ID=CAMNT_0008539499 /DNA_START=322 /DNA_END=3408 /DNA_ORIENTATION=+